METKNNTYNQKQKKSQLKLQGEGCEWIAEQGVGGEESKMTKIAMSCKRQEVVQNYDRPHPEDTWHIRNKIDKAGAKTFKCYLLKPLKMID